MLKLLLTILLCALQIHQINSHGYSNNPIEGYYWREYVGVAPSDALPGGSDYNNKPIYIGQALYQGHLIAGKIYESGNKVHVGINWIEHQLGEGAKILCTQNPEKFTWINTTVDDVKLLTNKHLVFGGLQLNNMVLYIGRIHHELETGVGKVYGGLYLPYKGKEIYFPKYEILTYNS